MTPLDRIQAHPPPFAGLLGREFVTAESDAASARMDFRPDLCTLGGALAFVTLRQGAARTTTLESKTNFVGAARVGATRLGVWSVVHRGRRTHAMQTRVETEEGRLVALVIQTQMTL